MNTLESNKKLFYLNGVPRAGNTLFASLLNQNPDVAVTANSIVMHILKEVYMARNTLPFKNYPDYRSLNNVYQNILKNYYEHWPHKYIIERSPVYTPGNQMLLKEANQPIKCIILWRDVIDILASFIKWFENEPSAFVNTDESYGKTIESKLKGLMSVDGIIAKSLDSVKEALRPENINNCHILRYDDFIKNPEEEIMKVYSFLEIPFFNHNYKSLGQFSVNGLGYDDQSGKIGKDLHTIRTDGIYKEDNSYRSMVPQRFLDAYGHITL